MIVQHNLTAINANRYLGINNKKLSKDLEKLSSGYQINRAGDNAAGLAVSEKMRSQITGINQAVKNAEDGISMIQTFEGALTETHKILNRMKELAVQVSNGTYDNDVDRAAAQLEFEQLVAELDQIADTDFNGVVTLNGGTMAGGKNQRTPKATNGTIQYTNTYKTTPGNDTTSDVEAGDVNGPKYESTVSVPNAFSAAEANMTYTSTIALQVGARSKDLVNFTFYYRKPSDWANAAGALSNNMDVSSVGLGFRSTKTANGTDSLNFNLISQGNANMAIDQIDLAINKTSLVRATFGAIQNRLEHKVDNLNVASENLTAAEARIRDTDMAKQMMEFTKNQILSQASQSMLAQANMLPQSVLSLLQ